MSTKPDALQPHHYTRFAIQPLDFIEANGIGFAAGNVIKYVCRHDAKNGVEDLKKARTYLDRMIEKAELTADKPVGILPGGYVPRQRSSTGSPLPNDRDFDSIR